MPAPCAGDMPSHGIYRILVCRPNHRLGNMLLMTPLITELERRYRGAEIDIVAEGGAARDVFASYFSVRNIYCLPTRGFKHPLAFLRLLAQIRRNHYDLVIDPCLGSGFSRILTRLFRGKRKLGYGDPAHPRGLTHVVPVAAAPRHMAQRPVTLLRWHERTQAGATSDFPPLDIRLSDGERAQGRQMVDELLRHSGQLADGPVIGIFANATGAKRYSGEWWRSFIAALRLALPSCRLVEVVPAHGSSMLEGKWPGYYSTSSRRRAAVMSAVDLMVSADCGVMHLAVASGVATAGLFSVTDEAVYGPYGSGCSVRSGAEDDVAAVVASVLAALPPISRTSAATVGGKAPTETSGPPPLHAPASGKAQPC